MRSFRVKFRMTVLKSAIPKKGKYVKKILDKGRGFFAYLNMSKTYVQQPRFL